MGLHQINQIDGMIYLLAIICNVDIVHATINVIMQWLTYLI